MQAARLTCHSFRGGEGPPMDGIEIKSGDRLICNITTGRGGALCLLCRRPRNIVDLACWPTNCPVSLKAPPSKPWRLGYQQPAPSAAEQRPSGGAKSGGGY